MNWKVVGASVQGFSHCAEGIPCQDFRAASVTSDGWLVAMVSDGAGSASRSAEGAKAICEGVTAYIVQKVLELKGSDREVPSEARAWVETGIEQVRSALEATGDDLLRVFHATVVGVIAGAKGGVFFHIGDGAACATSSDFSQYVMSLPENGEYANETYFFTEEEWRDHLRFVPFGSEFNVITLMTDGVTPFALGAGSQRPHLPFFTPVTEFLASHGQEDGETALIATLKKDAIRQITGDDKTFLWALRMESDVD